LNSRARTERGGKEGRGKREKERERERIFITTL